MEFISPDQWISEDSYVRLIDRFVETVVLKECDFHEEIKQGRPSYGPQELMNLYIYGYSNKIKSSRQLAKACRNNIEVKWLMHGLMPDFRTIADFRKNNIENLKEAYRLFVTFCKTHISSADGVNLFDESFYSVDGSKMRAVQSKDTCHTANKIDDRIANDEIRIQQFTAYLEELNQEDDKEEQDNKATLDQIPLSKEEIEEKLSKYKERLDQHKKIKKAIEESNTQYSENDPDARLMKTHHGAYTPCYNVQTAVDSNHHLIVGYNATNKCSDKGLLATTSDEIILQDGKIKEVVADKGYEDTDDISKCLGKGVIPHVIPSIAKDQKKTSYEVSYEYKETTVTLEELSSTKPEDISKCLHAGEVPECYKQYVEKAENNIREESILEYKDIDEYNIDAMSDEEKKSFAMDKGYFVRDIKNNKVYCPCGQILRQCSKSKDGFITYSNKLACERCPHRTTCFKETKRTRCKTVNFAPNCRVKGEDIQRRYPKTVGKIKKVFFKFTPDKEKMSQRKCISEHPFGTIKRHMHGDHFLLKGLRKIDAECALLFLGYNLKRLTKIVPVRTILEVTA